jgi:hypothetical protein
MPKWVMSAQQSPARPSKATERSAPVDRVQRHPNGERCCLHERSGRIRDSERKHELIELRKEERRDGGGDEIAAPAKERGAAEDDRCHGRQQIASTPPYCPRTRLAGSRCWRCRTAAQAVQQLRPHISARPEALGRECLP